MTCAPRFPLALTSEHFTEIGRVAAYWSRVEHCVQGILWRLLKVEADVGRHITATLRPDTHLDLVTVLCRCGLAPTETLCNGALELVERIKHLRGDRIAVVHGPWRLGEVPLELIKLKSKGLEPDLVPYPIEKIRAISESIIALADHLTDFIATYDFQTRS
jgi:hypothetical protein